MSKKWKIILIVLIGLFVLIQVFPVSKPESRADNPADLIASGNVDPEIANMLKTACYDCHSFETKYPWYSHLAPVKWLVIRDINEGRKDLNFSDWMLMDPMAQLEMLDEISTEVMSGEMPMKIYPLMHPEAKLSDADRQKISDWTEAYAETLIQ